MKKIILLTGVMALFHAVMAQEGNMRQHAPKQRLKSDLADSMRRMGMGQLPADTNRALLYNERAAPMDTMKVPGNRKRR
jgi:hypothetical protein